jgi:aspartyl-tRNA(Asn)/glutamyl-tRNA(Gln) amidotransferase subunit C
MSAPHLDVRYIANLVRLRLTEEEIAELQPQLDHVLSYIEQLDEVNVEGIEPTAHASAVYNVFRADLPRAGFTQEQATANAPHSGNGLFLVPKVVEG